MKFLLTLVISLLVTPPLLAAPETVAYDQQAPGYYRMTLGKLRITAVSEYLTHSHHPGKIASGHGQRCHDPAGRDLH